MDSPSPLEEEGGVVMDTVSSSLRPAQEMVGGSSTHHVQIMKASFFSQDDLNTTYSIPSPKLHPPLTGRLNRPGSRLEERVPFHPASRSSAHPSPGPSHGLFQTSLLSSRTFPSPLTTIRDQGLFPPPPQTAETVDPFTRFHTTTRRPLPLTQRATSGLQAQSAVLMARRNLNVLVPMPGRERCLCDHGLFLGRSFRVGWGPNWTLAHSGCLVSPSSPSKAAATNRGWGQGSGRFMTPAEEEGHPIRVVVERVSVNSSRDTVNELAL